MILKKIVLLIILNMTLNVFSSDIEGFPLIDKNDLSSYFSYIHSVEYKSLSLVDGARSFEPFFASYDIRYNNPKDLVVNLGISKKIEQKFSWLLKTFNIKKTGTFEFSKYLKGTTKDMDYVALYSDSIQGIFNYLNEKMKKNFTLIDLFILDTLYLVHHTDNLIKKRPELLKSKLPSNNRFIDNVMTGGAYKQKKNEPMYELMKNYLVSSKSFFEDLSLFPYFYMNSKEELTIGNITSDSLKGTWQNAFSEEPFFADSFLMLPIEGNYHDQLHFSILKGILEVVSKVSEKRKENDRPKNFKEFLLFSEKTLSKTLGEAPIENPKSRTMFNFYFLHEDIYVLKNYISMKYLNVASVPTGVSKEQLTNFMNDPYYFNEQAIIDSGKKGKFSESEIDLFIGDILKFNKMVAEYKCQHPLKP